MLNFIQICLYWISYFIALVISYFPFNNNSEGDYTPQLFMGNVFTSLYNNRLFVIFLLFFFLAVPIGLYGYVHIVVVAVVLLVFILVLKAIPDFVVGYRYWFVLIVLGVLYVFHVYIHFHFFDFNAVLMVPNFFCFTFNCFNILDALMAAIFISLSILSIGSIMIIFGIFVFICICDFDCPNASLLILYTLHVFIFMCTLFLCFSHFFYGFNDFFILTVGSFEFNFLCLALSLYIFNILILVYKYIEVWGPLVFLSVYSSILSIFSFYSTDVILFLFFISISISGFLIVHPFYLPSFFYSSVHFFFCISFFIFLIRVFLFNFYAINSKLGVDVVSYNLFFCILGLFIICLGFNSIFLFTSNFDLFCLLTDAINDHYYNNFGIYNFLNNDSIIVYLNEIISYEFLSELSVLKFLKRLFGVDFSNIFASAFNLFIKLFIFTLKNFFYIFENWALVELVHVLAAILIFYLVWNSKEFTNSWNVSDIFSNYSFFFIFLWFLFSFLYIFMIFYYCPGMELIDFAMDPSSFEHMPRVFYKGVCSFLLYRSTLNYVFLVVNLFLLALFISNNR